MDDRKLAEAKQKVREMILELDSVTEAARAALEVSDQAEAWKLLQQVYTRFDEATQRLKEMRRAVDAALAAPTK